MPKNTCYICGITIGVGNVHGCCADCLADKTTLYHRKVYEVELRKRAEKAEAEVERLRSILKDVDSKAEIVQLSRCPICDSDCIKQTYVNYLDCENMNKATCVNCKWTGYVKDLK